MTEASNPARRRFLAAAAVTGLAAQAAARAQTPPTGANVAFTPNTRYPDPAIEILDPGFAKYRLYSSSVEQLGSGMRWAEGPVHFPAGRYVPRPRLARLLR